MFRILTFQWHCLPNCCPSALSDLTRIQQGLWLYGRDTLLGNLQRLPPLHTIHRTQQVWNNPDKSFFSRLLWHLITGRCPLSFLISSRRDLNVLSLLCDHCNLERVGLVFLFVVSLGIFFFCSYVCLLFKNIFNQAKQTTSPSSMN